MFWRLLRSALRRRAVTGETISMSISGYLLLAPCWALFCFLLHQHQPGAFQIAGEPSPAPAGDHLLPLFTYFSLTALSTNSFGDVTPLSLQARYAAAEGVAGQFYLAILVARLVGLQMSPAGRPGG